MKLGELLFKSGTNALFHVYPDAKSGRPVEIYAPEYLDIVSSNGETPWDYLIQREVDRIDAGVGPWERENGREKPYIFVILKGCERTEREDNGGTRHGG
jgi:hypothetical protein